MPRIMVLVHCISTQWDQSAYEISSQQLEYFFLEYFFQKYETLSYGSCSLHFSLMRYIYLLSFMLMPCIIFKLCSGQKSSMKMNKGQ